MFQPFENHVTGYLTPAYSTLGKDEISRVKHLLPEVKIVLCVREPISRLWSQINMRFRQDFINEFDRVPNKSDREIFLRFCTKKKVEEIVSRDGFVKRSFATKTYEKWLDVYGSENMLIINFDDLTQKTMQVLKKLYEFLDLKGTPGADLKDNRKEDLLKQKINEDYKAILKSALKDEPQNFDRIFKEHKDRV